MPLRRISKRPVVRGDVTATDMLERASVEYSVNGPRATRVFMVENIGGAEEARLAVAPYVTGIPRLGDNHPAIEFLPVSNVRSELASKDSTTVALVTVEYSRATDGGGFINPPDDTAPAQIEVVSTVQSTTTNMDVNGAQIVVGHIIEDEEAQTSTYDEQGGEIEYQQPMHIVIFRRRENYSPGVSIPNGGRGSSVAYVGRINELAWMGAGARMWLCTKMDGYTDDGGVTWNNTYEFQRREPNWDATVVYRDRDTGQPIKIPAGSDPSEIATVVLYHTADFRELRLFG